MQEHLRILGLSDYEARIYETLLLASPQSATLIARKCTLSRSSVYTTLSSLTAKGLVGTTYKNDVKQFIANDFEALEELLGKEKILLERKKFAVEALKTLTPTPSSLLVPQTIFFEGQEGLKKIYLSMMRAAKKDEVLYLIRDEFVWHKEWEFVFKDDWHSRIKRMKKEKNITTKLLINASTLEKSKSAFYKKKLGLTFKYLSKKNAVTGFAQYVLGDTIAILSMEKNNLVGIQITNRHLAENYRKLFNSLWG